MKIQKIILITLILFIIFCFIILIIFLNSQPFNERYNLVLDINTKKSYELKQNIKLDQYFSNQRLNILLIGIDSRSGEPSRSDTLMVISINKTSNELRMISIPRDTFMNGTLYNKINSAHFIGGTVGAIDKVRELTGMPIHHYIKTNFYGFKDLVDTVGGIYLDVPTDLYGWEINGTIEGGTEFELNNCILNVSNPYPTPCKLIVKKGYQLLNGTEVLYFVRYRHFKDVDYGRVNNQKYFLESFISQTARPTKILRAPLIYLVAKKGIFTDMSIYDLMKLSLRIKFYKSKEHISLKGESFYMYNPHYDKDLYYIRINESSIYEAFN